MSYDEISFGVGSAPSTLAAGRVGLEALWPGGVVGRSPLLRWRSVLCRPQGPFPLGSAGQKQPLLLDQPFPLGIRAGVGAASLLHQGCACFCSRGCVGCHCKRQRGPDSELDERHGCHVGVFFASGVCQGPVCFSFKSEPKLSQ